MSADNDYFDQFDDVEAHEGGVASLEVVKPLHERVEYDPGNGRMGDNCPGRIFLDGEPLFTVPLPTMSDNNINFVKIDPRKDDTRWGRVFAGTGEYQNGHLYVMQVGECANLRLDCAVSVDLPLYDIMPVVSAQTFNNPEGGTHTWGSTRWFVMGWGISGAGIRQVNEYHNRCKDVLTTDEVYDYRLPYNRDDRVRFTYSEADGLFRMNNGVPINDLITENGHDIEMTIEKWGRVYDAPIRRDEDGR